MSRFLGTWETVKPIRAFFLVVHSEADPKGMKL